MAEDRDHVPAAAPRDPRARDAGPRENGDIIMQRVRVGLTGLAAVFLLTLLAASVFNMLGQDEHAVPRIGNSAVANSEDAPKEPLAELGMAPGNAPKAPPAAAKPAPIPTLSPPAPTGPGLVPVKPAR